MTVEGVLLYIGGGQAEHSAEMMRMSNFFHFRGQEGWLTASSGACTTLPTPGAGVQIAPGPFLVNSRFSGGDMQAYMGRVLTGTNVDTVNVPPGASRSDLVVMNVEDPYPSDGTFWPYPSSAANGPYAEIQVIQDVPSTCLSLDDLDTSRTERGWTCIPIARLDRPSNTGTITSDMIVNLRSIINPWAGIQLPQAILDELSSLESAVSTLGDEINGMINQKFPVPAAQLITGQIFHSLSSNTVHPSDTSWKAWPVEGQNLVIVPPWATKLSFSTEIIGAQFATSSSSSGVDANIYLGMRMVLGHSVSQITYTELVEPNDVYYSGCPDKRPNRPPIMTNIRCVGVFNLDPRDIGQVVQCSFQVAMFPNSSTGRLYNGQLMAIPGITAMSHEYEYQEGTA